MLTVKYFAYGSNIKFDRLRSRVEFLTEPIVNGEQYTLDGYRLVFNAGIDFGFSAYANIEEARGYSVEGILYDLTPAQFTRLDQYEAFYEKQYFQIDESTIGCVYIAKKEMTCKKAKRPDLTYLNTIIDGCEEQGLEDTYNLLVKYKLTNYKIRKSRHKFLK